ncbi:hypothetical protein [Nisaea nitritireducens]|uniref:hypothetical protein n=1 Tax=Nisaea nitritireducens TaxID=568392 RepID=UPI001867EABC|nr:hypothetical protein [Nisaea nitritireducens]
MAVPGPAEIIRAVYGCWCLALGRPGAIDLFDRSEAGFFRSFFAAALALPAFVLSDVVNGGAAWLDGGLLDWVSYALRYAIYWLVFPLVACIIAEKIGALDRILDLLVPYNWVTLPFGYLFCALTVIRAGEGPVADLAESLSVFVWVGLLFLMYRWARQLLGVSALMAFGFVLADEMVSLVSYLLLESVAASM